MTRFVNADDFGRDSQVNRAIVESFAKGYINQTTLMVNMPVCDEAVELARKNGFADKVGLHLNFTQGVPLTMSIRKITACCDEKGCFATKSFALNGDNLANDVKRSVEEETRAQIEKYLSYNLPLMHCDGHHHVHARLPIARVVMPILKAYGFKTVRNRYSIVVRNLTLPNCLALFTPYHKSARLNLEYLSLLKTNGLATTNHFAGWSVCNVRAFAKCESYELMVHPNYNSNGDLVDVQDWVNGDGPMLSQLKEQLNI